MPSLGDSATTRVFLVDSHDIFRLGMRLSLAEEPGLEVVGEAPDVETAVPALTRQLPHVAVIGIRSHEERLVHDLPSLRRHAPGTRLLVVSRRPQDHAVAIRNGASATLGKDIAGDELAAAVHDVASGRRRASWPESGGATGSASPAADLPRLTSQERKVLALIGEGLSNREIAERLFLAEKTVRNHVTRLLAKLGVARRTQAALIAVRVGMLSHEPER